MVQAGIRIGEGGFRGGDIADASSLSPVLYRGSVDFPVTVILLMSTTSQHVYFMFITKTRDTFVIDGDSKLARRTCGRGVAELLHCEALGKYVHGRSVLQEARVQSETVHGVRPTCPQLSPKVSRRAHRARSSSRIVGNASWLAQQAAGLASMLDLCPRPRMTWRRWSCSCCAVRRWHEVLIAVQIGIIYWKSVDANLQGQRHHLRHRDQRHPPKAQGNRKLNHETLLPQPCAFAFCWLHVLFYWRRCHDGPS